MAAGARAAGSEGSKSFGFSKGFLLSGKEKSRRKKTKLAKINVQSNVAAVQPTGIVDKGESSITRSKEKAPRASSALLDLENVSQRSFLLLDEPTDQDKSDAPSVTGPLHNLNLGADGLEEGFGLQEVSSKPLISVIDDKTNASTAHQTDEVSAPPLDDTLMPPMNPTSLLVLSKELHRVLLRRRGYTEFIQTHVVNPESRFHVWNIILPRVAKDGPDFGAALLLQQDMECVSSFCHVMVQETAAPAKQILLGGSLVLSYIIRSQRNKKISHLQLVQSMVLPKLVQLVQDSIDKRTVLANEAMVAAYGLLSLDEASIRSSFLDLLLVVHEKWLSSKKKDTWRKRCTLAVIQDWKRVGTVLGSAVSVEGVCDDFGGMRQTLFDPKPMSTDDIVSLLKHLDTSCMHVILRGIIAVFGNDKKLWSQDSLQSVVALLIPIVLNHHDTDLVTTLLVILLQVTDDLDNVMSIILTGLTSKGDGVQQIGKPWKVSLLRDVMVSNNRFAAVLQSISKSMFQTPDAMAPLVFFGSLVDIDMDSEKNVDRVMEGVLAVLSISITEMERNTQDIYQRLAPLLLIRRIPADVYKVLWDKFVQDRQDVQLLLTKFVTRLATLLNSENTTPSERKLAAEIAGRCLPFTLDRPYSAFTMILLPSFRALLAGDARACRPVKAALYVACCHLPLAIETEPMQAVASFCLWLVNQENENLAECKQGCMEFFAASLQATLVKGNAIDPIRTRLENILLGKRDEQGIHARIGEDKLGLNTLDLTSPVVVLSVWNAFLLVSQRLERELGGLDTWASQMGPWLLDYLCNCQVSAAALQVLFVLITRSKSCVTGDLEQTVNMSHDALKSQDPATRLAALKLIMAIISLDIDRFQRLSQSGATLITIAAVAHKFDDTDFQDLAKHILQ